VSTSALQAIAAQIPEAFVDQYLDRSQAAWGVVDPTHLVAVVTMAKERLGFRLFVSMDCVDRLHLPPDEQDPRFEVVYFFRNVEQNEVLRLKVQAAEGEEVPSIRHVYQGANWAERFVWDFYGVPFKGHGDLRRILMYDEFQGHPLRKDYPLRGRQALVPERPIQDIFRGPGTNGVG
jgi:NADH-quinone oxidoreductase subunit C